MLFEEMGRQENAPTETIANVMAHVSLHRSPRDDEYFE